MFAKKSNKIISFNFILISFLISYFGIISYSQEDSLPNLTNGYYDPYFEGTEEIDPALDEKKQEELEFVEHFVELFDKENEKDKEGEKDAVNQNNNKGKTHKENNEVEENNDKLKIKAIKLAVVKGYQSVIPHLIKIAKDKNEKLIVRNNAFFAIVDINVELGEYLFIEIAQDKAENVVLRSRAILILGKMGSHNAISALSQILKDKEEKSMVRTTAARALGYISNTSVKDVLFEVMIKSVENTSLRVACAWALSSMEDAVTMLIEALEDYDDSFTKVCIVFALTRIKDPQALEALLKTLATDDVVLKKKTAAAILSMGEKYEIQEKILAYLDSYDTRLQIGAAYMCGKLKIEGSAEKMHELLKSLDFSYYDLTYNLIWALGQHKYQESWKDIAYFFRTPGEERRVLAVKVLAQMKIKEAIPILINLLHDNMESDRVKKLAIKALHYLNAPADLVKENTPKHLLYQ